MSTPHAGNAGSRDLSLRPRPEGWPVGSFDSYADAQAAVDMLSDKSDFPVAELTIVGVDLMEVGLFFGMLLGIFSENFISPIFLGIVMGVVFGIVASAVPYAASRGRRDFTTRTQIVAGRYDVLCTPAHAAEARDAIARFSFSSSHRNDN